MISELNEEEWQLVEEYEDVGYAKARVEVVFEQSSQYVLTYARPDD